MVNNPISIDDTLLLDAQQLNSFRELWNKEFPKQIRYTSQEDFECYLYSLQDLRHYFIVDDFHSLQGWSFTFNRDAETWFGLLVDTNFQHMGIGTRLLQNLKANHASLNGWVIDHHGDFKQNGEPYISPVPFYLKNEFILHPEIRMESDHLSGVKMSWKREPDGLSPEPGR